METQTDQPAPNPLPTWLSIPIILICLGGGGWIIHWYVMTDPISHESKILGDPPAQVQWPAGPGGGRNRGLPPRRIQDRTGGRYEAFTEQAHADVTVANGKATFHLIAYMNYAFVPDEPKKTIFAARNLIRDATRTAALKLTPNQINKLRGLTWTLTMVVKPEDKELLGKQLAQYVAAAEKDRPAAEIQALKTLDEIAARSTEATRQEAIDHANQINSIITPDMWKQNTAMGGGK
jgi:hypothetical protein